jgi:hypothetical protein
MATEQTPLTYYAVDLASLAREIAMDIFPTQQVIEIHKLSDEEWQRFQEMLASMQREWFSAGNTRERVRVKAATGLEAMLETYIREIGDERIPLTQRVEAGKFLARLGELESGNTNAAGGGVIINITTSANRPTLTLTANPVLEETE